MVFANEDTFYRERIFGIGWNAYNSPTYNRSKKS
jgi:hypothetical protein